MTKEEFLDRVNFSRYPKYELSQIKDGTPEKECVAIVCTKSDSILLAKYNYGKWEQACFSSTEYWDKQEIYYNNINEDIVYWTDGRPQDDSIE